MPSSEEVAEEDEIQCMDPAHLREAFDLTLEFEKEVPDYTAWPQSQSNGNLL